VHPREVLKQRAGTLNAAAVVLAHNHPSGNRRAEPQRSAVDRGTQRLLLMQIDVRVLDHVVVAGTGATVSLADRGLL
jgi:DNA repair protein RadC